MSYLTEAFRQLNLTEAAFMADDEEDILGARELLNKDANVDINVFDTEADSEEDLQDNYVGKVILGCSVCHKLFFKSPDEVDLGDIDEEDLDEDSLVNIDEECPICNSTDGFFIKGEIKPYHSFDIEYEVEDEDDDEEESDEDEEESEDIEDDESEEDEESEDEEDDDKEEKNESLIRRNLSESAESEIQALIKDEEEAIDGYNKAIDRFKEIKGDEEEHIDELNQEKDNIKDESLEEANDRNALIASLDSKLKDADDAFNDIRDELGESLGLTEGFNNVDVSTDSEHLTMTQDENQKVTITTEPLGGGEFSDGISEGDEFISPVSDETLGEIGDANAENNAEEAEDIAADLDLDNAESGDDIDLEAGEEPVENDEEEIPEDTDMPEEDIDITDIKEESFNRLGTSYLKNTYDNVVSFNTTSAKLLGESLVLEGVIMFDSGNRKATKFVFEGTNKTKDGKYKFIGENLDITRGKKAFSMIGSINEGCLMTESLKYDYMQGNVRVNGKESI